MNLIKKAERFASKVALEMNGQELTFEQLLKESHDFASGLIKKKSNLVGERVKYKTF